MKLKGAFLHRYSSPCSKPIVTSSTTVRKRDGIILKLIDSDGRCGFGEAAPWPGWGSTLLQVEQCLNETIAPNSFIWDVQWDALSKSAFMQLLQSKINFSEAAAALELALLDLIAQHRSISLAKLLSPLARQEVIVHALISDVKSAKAAVTCKAQHFKIKIGADPFLNDEQRLYQIREAVGPNAFINIDVNGGWDLATATKALTRWQKLNINLIEQPLAATSDKDEFLELRRRTGACIAIDEGLRCKTDLVNIIKNQIADVVVIKPMMVGGLLVANHMARQANQAGIKVIITSMFESAIGRSGALHLAAALAKEPLACGFTGCIANDGTKPVANNQQVLQPQSHSRGLAIALPLANGLGITAHQKDEMQ
ncbi:MAG: o-succinylbenzoate synthase [Deltaproteobacteria bacterium]|nr:o-succinylbenzoate synthase [Deltaproteobacteria bacterium]